MDPVDGLTVQAVVEDRFDHEYVCRFNERQPLPTVVHVQQQHRWRILPAAAAAPESINRRSEGSPCLWPRVGQPTPQRQFYDVHHFIQLRKDDALLVPRNHFYQIRY